MRVYPRRYSSSSSSTKSTIHIAKIHLMPKFYLLPRYLRYLEVGRVLPGVGIPGELPTGSLELTGQSDSMNDIEITQQLF